MYNTNKKRHIVTFLQENTGCSHYSKNCKIVAPCCDKVYWCRFCHNDKEDHQLNRKLVVELVCNLCKLRQYVQDECKQCEAKFGYYACLACKFFENADRKQFHCNGCGICRVGGRENFVHCYKCGMCIPIGTLDGHKCVENSGFDECPICLEQISESTTKVKLLKCGHYLHEACYASLVANNITTCGLCRQTM